MSKLSFAHFRFTVFISLMLILSLVLLVDEHRQYWSFINTVFLNTFIAAGLFINELHQKYLKFKIED